MLIIEMMARWKVGLSYGSKTVGEVRLENGIIQGDAFSPLLFVLMIDPIIKIMKRTLGGSRPGRLLHGRLEGVHDGNSHRTNSSWNCEERSSLCWDGHQQQEVCHPDER